MKNKLINSVRRSDLTFLVVSRLHYSRDLVFFMKCCSFSMLPCVVPLKSNNKCLHAHRYAIVVRAIGMYQRGALQCDGHWIHDSQTLVNNTSCVCTFSLSAFSCLKKNFIRCFMRFYRRWETRTLRIIFPTGRKRLDGNAGSCFRIVDNKRLHDTTDCQRSCAIDRVISHIISRAWPRFTKGIKIMRKFRNSYKTHKDFII